MNNDTPLKTCSKCKQSFPATTEHFYKRAKARDGLQHMCHECAAAYQREHYANPEIRKKQAAVQREYDARPEVRERKSAHKRERYANNPEVREKAKISKRNRRTAEGKFTVEDVQIALRSQNGKCWHCSKPVGDNYHIDHLIPIARGGTNNPNNICIACAVCNFSKGSKLTQEWNGRLF